MGVVNRINFYPDKYIAGTSRLTLEERGAYWSVCCLIYTNGGPIENDDHWIAAALFVDVRKWRPLKQRLISKGKLLVTNGLLSNERCQTEIAWALQRIEEARRKGKLGGRPQKAIPPEMSRDLRGVSAEDVKHIQTPDLNKSNRLEKAGGYETGNLSISSLKKDRQTTKKATKKGQKTYAFEGRAFRITTEDFARWSAEFTTYPDLLAELAEIDRKFADMADPPRSAFHMAEAWLRKGQETRPANGTNGYIAGDRTWWQKENDQWRVRVQCYVDRETWMEHIWGAKPGISGSAVPAAILAEFPSLKAGGSA